ncbi:all-trans-retinol 13,14-reductase-like [Babylonia areolata]|uniref:all-trans-retinol 13,14-reductase-like n=1 Tax=Babylonia areolata TaxID=304850 RepID=UPI003FD54B4D
MAVEKFFDYLIENPKWILVGLATYTCIYLVSRLFSGPRPGRNPFAVDHRRSKEPLVSDPQARDAILKQRFKQTKVPENLDAIVVGSGAGGLVTAVLLARAGKRVLVLEQHDQAGGCCHTFVEKGYEFDTGIHYIGDMNNTRSRVLLDQLTGGQLDWAPMDDQFDEVAIGDPEKAQRFGMRSGERNYYDNLIKFFPEEEAAIRKYEELISLANKSFNGIVILKVLPRFVVTVLLKTGLYRLLFSCFKYSAFTLQETLDGLTSNQDLKTVLSYICGDYGVFPENVPFILHAILIHHYRNGAYYPVGGPSEIAYQMTHIIERHGGRVLMQAPVSEILCSEKGAAIGVRVARSSGSVDLHAKYIISDAGAINTFRKLLPASVAQKSCMYPVVGEVGPSTSFLTTFVGVDGSQADLKLPSGNTWYYSRNDINKAMSDYLALSLEDVASAPIPLCYISFPSAKDPSWEQRHPGKSSVLIITLANWEWFQSWEKERKGHRGEDYEGIKNTIGEQMWRVCCHLFPQLDGKRDYMEVGTPVTNQYYLGQPSGEMYGLDQGRKRFTPQAIATLRADTDIPGLYLTGQDVLLCGFTSVLYAGMICASQILRRNVLSDFNKLREQLKQQQGTARKAE